MMQRPLSEAAASSASGRSGRRRRSERASPGIDILYDRLGTGYLIEVNVVAGWRAFQTTTETDVAALVIKQLEQESSC